MNWNEMIQYCAFHNVWGSMARYTQHWPTSVVRTYVPKHLRKVS